jgi:hypothetical protein
MISKSRRFVNLVLLPIRSTPKILAAHNDGAKVHDTGKRMQREKQTANG